MTNDNYFFLKYDPENSKVYFIFGNDLLKLQIKDYSIKRVIKKFKLGDFCCISKRGRYITSIKCIDRVTSTSLLNVYNLFLYAQILDSVRSFFKKRCFLEVRLPSIHFGEGKGDSFYFSFFGKKARLTASNALYSTILGSCIGKVYTIQRVFRAERSKTSKHLAEFDMLEATMLCKNIDDGILICKELVKSIANAFEVDIPSFNEVEYKDVVKQFSIQFGKGLGCKEKIISKDGAIFVKNFHKDLSSWAAKPINDEITESFNLLLPNVGEVAEGCLRNTNVNDLRKRFSKANLNEQLIWYVKKNQHPNLKFLSVGIGIERLAMWLFKVKNIREMQAFHRDRNSKMIDG